MYMYFNTYIHSLDKHRIQETPTVFCEWNHPDLHHKCN